MDRTSLLKKTFPGLTDALIDELKTYIREVTYPGGTVLCTEGADESTFYLIAAGQVSITKWLEFAREERHIRNSGPGDFFGEMAIINNAPRAATARTIETTTVLELDRDHFLKIIGESPEMALAMVRTTIDRLRSNDSLQFEELRNTFEALQRLDQAKLDFIEVAAHELRTPLTVIQGYGKVLSLEVNDKPHLMEVSKGLQDGITRMLQIVNAMLDVSKIDSQTLKVARVPVLPKLVAKEAISTFNEAITERGITVTEQHEISEKLPFIYADPTLMNKLFFQLISNAIKYTPDNGIIEIRTRETNDSRIGHGIEIIVKDNGVGISNEHMQHIFEKFYQAGDVSLHSSSKTAFMGGGPGLGLAIVRGIVEAHDGFIWAESEGFNPNNPPGTAFHILLPEGSSS